MSETPSYKATLHLPKTPFKMRGGLANKEPKLIERWSGADLYGQIQKARQGQPAFILHDGPPYANGNIHHGHILNKVLKDFVVKHRTMEGRFSPYVPGWDCHGLPIEHKVDQQLGKKKASMSQVEIRKACRAYADKFVAVQRDEFRRLGIFGAWDDPYRTMSYLYESMTVRQLGEVFDSGAVYKGLKPVHWSWAAETALADAEVEYEAYTAPSIYVKFRFPNPPATLAEAAGDRDVFVLIWTTTPWTLPANLAIALNPAFDYELLGLGDGDAVIVATGLKASVLDKCKIDPETVEVLASFVGSDLVGHGVDDCPRHTTRHPFIDRDSVLLPADYVTLEQGTGCVHTAPGHGQDDFHLGKQFGLDVLNPVDNRGLYTKKFALMEGEHVFKANPKVIELLQEKGRLALAAHPQSPHRALPALLAHQKAGHLPGDGAVVCGHGQGTVWHRADLARPRLARDRRGRLGAVVGQRSHLGHDGEPTRLVHLAPALVGRADYGHVLRRVRHRHGRRRDREARGGLGFGARLRRLV